MGLKGDFMTAFGTATVQRLATGSRGHASPKTTNANAFFVGSAKGAFHNTSSPKLGYCWVGREPDPPWLLAIIDRTRRGHRLLVCHKTGHACNALDKGPAHGALAVPKNRSFYAGYLSSHPVRESKKIDVVKQLIRSLD